MTANDLERLFNFGYDSKNKNKSSVDEIGERYRLNHAIVVKLYHPAHTQFSRNIRLSHGRIATFFRFSEGT